MNKRDVLIWLNSFGISNSTIKKLEESFSDLENVWSCNNKDILRIRNIKEEIKNNIIQYKNKNYFYDIMNKLISNKVDTITIYDKEYPNRLKNIYDSPKVLYCKGKLLDEDNISLSIIGSRKATNYGRWAAMKFSSELARMGITIISGMAQGIDTYAHQGALEAGGRSIGILGSGIDVIYPNSNKNLYYNLIENGAVLSEYFIGTKPLPYNFPKRNRIISGLSLGVIVIEAKEKSGSLITVEHAIDQGREVFALPGNVNSIFSKGTNKLIKEGCKLITDIEDIIEEIYELKEKCISKSSNIDYNNLSDKEKTIMNTISEAPIHADMIIYNTGISASEVNSILTILELKGLIRKMNGNMLTINWT